MKNLDPEQARVLLKRIKKLVYQCRYYPKETADMDAVAFEVIRPYMMRQPNDGEQHDT